MNFDIIFFNYPHLLNIVVLLLFTYQIYDSFHIGLGMLLTVFSCNLFSSGEILTIIGSTWAGSENFFSNETISGNRFNDTCFPPINYV